MVRWLTTRQRYANGLMGLALVVVLLSPAFAGRPQALETPLTYQSSGKLVLVMRGRETVLAAWHDADRLCLSSDGQSILVITGSRRHATARQFSIERQDVTTTRPVNATGVTGCAFGDTGQVKFSSGPIFGPPPPQCGSGPDPITYALSANSRLCVEPARTIQNGVLQVGSGKILIADHDGPISLATYFGLAISDTGEIAVDGTALMTGGCYYHLPSGPAVRFAADGVGEDSCIGIWLVAKIGAAPIYLGALKWDPEFISESSARAALRLQQRFGTLTPATARRFRRASR